MSNFFKGAIDRIKKWLGYAGSVRALLNLIENFPGISDSASLREYMLKILLKAENLSLLTQNTADDWIAAKAITLIEGDKSWSAIFDLIQLIDYSWAKYYPLEVGDYFEPADQIKKRVYDNNSKVLESIKMDCFMANEIGNPAMIIAAIGLILQIVVFLRARKEENK